MRQSLAVAGAVVVIIGLPLYLMPQNTNERFFWTVRTDLSATFLGASYLAAAVIALSAARERSWANARIGVPAALVFTTLTLFITLLNDDQSNYSAPGFLQSAGTWARLVIYAVVPPIMMVLLWLQLRHGGDPVRLRSLPTSLRGVLAAGGALLLIGGVMLLLSPDAASWMWPWSVNELTARAFGAWMVGFGVATAHIAWEADWRRVRAASTAADRVRKLVDNGAFPRQVGRATKLR
jgi:hypothetical protein